MGKSCLLYFRNNAGLQVAPQPLINESCNPSNSFSFCWVWGGSPWMHVGAPISLLIVECGGEHSQTEELPLPSYSNLPPFRPSMVEVLVNYLLVLCLFHFFFVPPFVFFFIFCCSIMQLSPTFVCVQAAIVFMLSYVKCSGY